MIRNNEDQVHARNDALTTLPSRAVTMVIPAGSEMTGLGGDSSHGVNLDGYLHAFRRTWLWCIITGGVLAAAATTLILLFVDDQYTATAELRAYTRAPQLVNSKTPQAQDKYETFISNVQQLLMSRTTLTGAVRDPKFQAYPVINEQDDPATWLAERLRVSVPRNSEILKVSVTVPQSKELASELANAVVDMYLQRFVFSERDEKFRKVEQLKGLLEEKRSEERQRRNDLAAVAQRSGSVDIESLDLAQQIELQKAQQVKTELARTRVELHRAQSERDASKARLEQMMAQGIEVPADELDVLVAADPEARMITEEIAILETGISKAGEVVKAQMSDSSQGGVAVGFARQYVVELVQKLEAIKDRLRKTWKVDQVRTLEKLIADKELQSNSLKMLEDELKKEAEAIDKKVSEIGSTSYQIEMRRDEIERLSGVAGDLSSQLELAQIDQQSADRVELIAKAEPPVRANLPGQLALAIIAGLTAFVLPGIGMILLDVRSQRVNSVKEVRDQLGLPVFGAVPILPSRATRRLGSASGRGRRWQALLSEAIGGIRANLLRLNDVRVVMVTSSVGGEGKTTVATQLAMSLARVGKRTLLVDFDLPRPAINNVFDLPLEPGICDVLRGDYTLDEVVHDVPLPNLYVATSGLGDAASSRFMNSARMEELIQELRDQFDYVIVDGSPLIPVADARVVSRYVDGAICCVLRDVSRLSLIRQSADLLESFNVRLLGTVVTAKQDTCYLSYGGDREEYLQATGAS